MPSHLKMIATVLMALSYAGGCAAAEEVSLSAKERERVLDLVAKLGSDNFFDRKNSETALLESPPGAISILHDALRNSKDAEIRMRLRNVLVNFANRFCEASRGYKVSLKFTDAPLGNVLKDFARQVKLDDTLFSDMLTKDSALGLVTVELTEMEDRYALRWLLRLGGVPVANETAPLDKVHNLEGLCLKPEDVHELLTKVWMEERFSEGGRTATLDGEKLKVHANEGDHEQIDFILKQLREQKPSKRIAFKLQDSSWTTACKAMLKKKKISFEMQDRSLEDAIATIQSISSVPLIIDPMVLAAGPPTINLRVTDMDTELALDWVLRLCDLGVVFRDHAAFVTKTSLLTKSEDRESLILDVSDLLNVPGYPMTITNLADMLRTRVRPETWDAALGTGIQEHGDKLVIIQLPDVVPMIDLLFSSFRSYLAMIKKVEPDGKWPDHALKPEEVPVQDNTAINEMSRKFRKAPLPEPGPGMKAIQDALRKDVSLDVTDVMLEDVIKDLNKKIDARFILDPKICEEGANKTAITMRAVGLRADLALRWIMRLSDLEFDIQNEATFITKRSNLSSNSELQIYYVRDLAGTMRAEELQGLIKDKIFPAEFADPATSIDESGGMLVVMQRPEIQKQILALLTHLRLHGQDKALMIQPLLRAETGMAEIDNALQLKLASRVSGDFKQATLADILKSLQDQSGVALIAVDPRLTNTVGEKALHLDLKFDNVPLQDALEKAASACHAGYVLKDGAVFICDTAKILAVECGIYKVEDIQGLTTLEILQALIKNLALEEQDPQTGASLEVHTDRIVAMQPPEAHKRIQDALEKMRAEKK